MALTLKQRKQKRATNSKYRKSPKGKIVSNKIAKKYMCTTKGRYKMIKARCVRKKMPIDSYIQLLPLLLKPCYYCKETKRIGLDRINNDLGYIADNCLPCCGRCNVTRNVNWSVQETLVMIKAVLKYRKKQAP